MLQMNIRIVQNQVISCNMNNTAMVHEYKKEKSSPPLL